MSICIRNLSRSGQQNKDIIFFSKDKMSLTRVIQVCLTSRVRTDVLIERETPLGVGQTPKGFI